MSQKTILYFKKLKPAFLWSLSSKQKAEHFITWSHRKNNLLSLWPHRRIRLQWHPFLIEWNHSRKTVRNHTFQLSTKLNFSNLVKWYDLPIHFNLRKRQVLRYNAQFYGVEYNINKFSYNLWLTMGLKKNIGVPWGLYFYTPWVRKDYLAYIYKTSWNNYAFAVKNSFCKETMDIVSLQNNKFTFYLKSQFIMHLSDCCIWNLRRKFYSHRAIKLYENDLNFEVSTYDVRFNYDFKDLCSRSNWFWVADNGYFRNPTFLIDSYDPRVTLASRKHLMYKWRLSIIYKFHRSWQLFKKIPSLNSIPKASMLLLSIFKYMKNFFDSNINIYMHIFINKSFNLNIYMFKYISLIQNNKYLFFNMMINLKRFFKWFFFNFFSYYPKEVYIILPHETPKILPKLAMIKQFSNLQTFSNSLITKWALICSNFRSAFKLWYKIKKRVFMKVNRFKWVNIYFRSHGYFKFRIKRWHPVLRGGFSKFKSIGIRRALGWKRIYKARFDWNQLFVDFRRGKVLLPYIKKFLKFCFNLYFLCLKPKFSLNLNFFKNELIENYLFQMSFMLYILLQFKRLFMMPLRKRSWKKWIRNKKGKEHLRIFKFNNVWYKYKWLHPWKWSISQFRLKYMKKYFSYIVPPISDLKLPLHLDVHESSACRYLGSNFG